MRILFLGDIVGKDGRDIIFKYLDDIKSKEAIDFTIVNGENSAHGKGITYKIYKQLISAGIDAITLGNHAYAKKEIIDYIDECDKLVFPYNFPNDYPNEVKIFEWNNLKIAIINLIGNAFMMENKISTFDAMENILDDIEADIYFVDYHGETTAEKILFAHQFKDKVQVIVGTHTHVQTADERIMGKCAYITDVGMNGVYDSIIGRDVEEMINAVIYHEKTRFTVATGPAILSGVIIDIDEDKKIATNIKRLQIRPKNVV